MYHVWYEHVYLYIHIFAHTYIFIWLYDMSKLLSWDMYCKLLTNNLKLFFFPGYCYDNHELYKLESSRNRINFCWRKNSSFLAPNPQKNSPGSAFHVGILHSQVLCSAVSQSWKHGRFWKDAFCPSTKSRLFPLHSQEIPKIRQPPKMYSLQLRFHFFHYQPYINQVSKQVRKWMGTKTFIPKQTNFLFSQCFSKM